MEHTKFSENNPVYSMDPYEILGIDNSYTASQIKSRYYEISKLLMSPYLRQDDTVEERKEAEWLFRMIHAAYRILVYGEPMNVLNDDLFFSKPKSTKPANQSKLKLDVFFAMKSGYSSTPLELRV